MSNSLIAESIRAAEHYANLQEIDGQEFKTLFEASIVWLRTNQQIVNSLNVFPVPDGDTGTNMLLTMQAAYSEISNLDDHNIGKIAHSIAQGALLGARGNSGVILSQLWRGFARSLDSREKMDLPMFVRALGEARNTAYKGVVRPVEGTILTVAKDVALAAEQFEDQNNMISFFDRIVSAADVSVKHTPELLPILKQAGVVDSGGKGLFFILDGMLRFMKGLPLDTAIATVQPLSAMQTEQTAGSIEPGQDFEIVIDFRPSSPLNLDQFYSDLSVIGTSIQVGEGDGIYRMHIHTPLDRRYDPINYIMKLGTVTKVAMENLVAQMQDMGQPENQPLKLQPIDLDQIAVVVVSPGHGISQIFASLGAAAIVEGGQTMNPSTEEILHAFEDLPTDKIIILPNNKNIILAAENAAAMSVKRVLVVASKTIPQGLSAMLRLNPEGDFDKVSGEMDQALKEVETGEITVATRTVTMNGVHVEQGHVIALHNGHLIGSAASIEEACLNLLEAAGTNDRERITLFYGNNITRSEVDLIVEKLAETYPDQELEVHAGGQPHYHFIIAIE
jgi:DAK2 domain fusion protein YloV